MNAHGLPTGVAHTCTRCGANVLLRTDLGTGVLGSRARTVAYDLTGGRHEYACVGVDPKPSHYTPARAGALR